MGVGFSSWILNKERGVSPSLKHGHYTFLCLESYPFSFVFYISYGGLILWFGEEEELPPKGLSFCRAVIWIGTARYFFFFFALLNSFPKFPFSVSFRTKRFWFSKFWWSQVPSQTTALPLPSAPTQDVSKPSSYWIASPLQTSDDSFLPQDEPRAPYLGTRCFHAWTSPALSSGDITPATYAILKFLVATLK